MSKVDYIEILHDNPNITTLEGFMEENGVEDYSIGPKPDSLIQSNSQQQYFVTGLGGESKYTAQDLLNYLDNSSSIYGSYTEEDLQTTSVAITSILRTPTVIKVPRASLNKEYISTGGNLVVPTKSIEAFIGERIREITLQKDYIAQKDTVNPKSNTFRINSNISVWIYCKALGKSDDEGKLFNLTPFIQSVTTNVGDNGGNFSLSLLPVTGEYLGSSVNSSTPDLPREAFQEWIIKHNTFSEFEVNKNNNSRSITQRDSIHKNTPEGVRRNNFFFHETISQNDIVFIRYETLELEKDRQKDLSPKNIANKFDISPKELPGKIYDMIGLVDTNSLSYNSSGADVSISIAGRDMMKLLIEDGQYFFPTDFITNTDITNQGNKPFERLISGDINIFNLYLDHYIDFPLKFIFNCLSNVEIVNSKLFSFYQSENDDTKSADPYDLKTNRYEYRLTDDKKELKNVEAAGVWSIIKLLIDPQVKTRKLVDSSITTDSGSILNFINKVCQKPFVEFFGDTYLDKYAFIVRKPPFDYKGFMSNKSIDNGNKDGINQVDFITIGGKAVYGDSLSFYDSEVYSWYRLVALGNYMGDEQSSLLDFPFLFFDEYAKIWGSRPMEVTSNYINYYAYITGKTVTHEYLIDQATQDLGWLIETNALLPFTRRGTLRIKGDRRIKRGMTIRYEETGELFYVEAVNQTYSVSGNSIDRETTLTVSRGIIEKYAKLYFNIINLDKDSSGKCGDRSKFKVDKDIFNFFLKRRQFQ